MREALDTIGVSGEEIQQVSDPVLGENVFQIQTAELEPDTVKDAQRELETEFGIAEDGFDSTSVGPTFGQQVADSALKALIFSLLVICGYVALRFDPKFAVPVLIAIFHDILITAGVYSLTGKEVSSGTVAAFLTILGYSIYDTIIVFDRIRENVPRMPRAAFSQIVNRSMSEVLTRSLATSFSTVARRGLAAGLRRRHAAGLRLRDAGRDRLRYLLVDLHRLTGPDRVEGTRAGLRAAAPADRRGRGQRAGLCRRHRLPRTGRRRGERSRDRRRAGAGGCGPSRRRARWQPSSAPTATAPTRPATARSTTPRVSGGSETPSARRGARPAASTGGTADGRGELMALLVWFTMGIALWHFTVFLPDHFWQGIVGAFVGAVIGSLPLRPDRAGGKRQRPRRHRPWHGAAGDSRHRDRPRGCLVHRHPRRDASRLVRLAAPGGAISPHYRHVCGRFWRRGAA